MLNYQFSNFTRNIGPTVINSLLISTEACFFMDLVHTETIV